MQGESAATSGYADADVAHLKITLLQHPLMHLQTWKKPQWRTVVLWQYVTNENSRLAKQLEGSAHTLSRSDL
jgi:hypothetical protein